MPNLPTTIAGLQAAFDSGDFAEAKRIFFALWPHMGYTVLPTVGRIAIADAAPALADAVWDALASRGAVDARGGAEYERRIAGLRAWLCDTDGSAPVEGDE